MKVITCKPPKLVCEADLLEFQFLKLVQARGFHLGPRTRPIHSREDDFAAWFDHLVESSLYKEVQLIKFCMSVKTSCPPCKSVGATVKPI